MIARSAGRSRHSSQPAVDRNGAYAPSARAVIFASLSYNQSRPARRARSIGLWGLVEPIQIPTPLTDAQAVPVDLAAELAAQDGIGHIAAAAVARDHAGAQPPGGAPLQQIDHVEDISEYIDVKLAAVRAYKSQCDVLSFDDAIQGLNRYRGEMHSWPGGDYAEIFRSLRW